MGKKGAPVGNRNAAGHRLGVGLTSFGHSVVGGARYIGSGVKRGHDSLNKVVMKHPIKGMAVMTGTVWGGIGAALGARGGLPGAASGAAIGATAGAAYGAAAGVAHHVGTAIANRINGHYSGKSRSKK